MSASPGANWPLPAPLVLASGSPRRRHLLAEAGIDFTVIVPDESAECGVCSGESPPELVARLAYQKARSVARQVDHALVLGCDTIAFCAGQVLGKPQNRWQAQQMLELLAGRRHQVYSGLCLWHRPSDRRWVDVDRAELVMDPITRRQIDEYLDGEAWLGKAGAFGYQDGLDWVHIDRGSESNVVGLPMELLQRTLNRINQELAVRNPQRRDR